MYNEIFYVVILLKLNELYLFKFEAFNVGSTDYYFPLNGATNDIMHLSIHLNYNLIFSNNMYF